MERCKVWRGPPPPRQRWLDNRISPWLCGHVRGRRSAHNGSRWRICRSPRSSSRAVVEPGWWRLPWYAVPGGRSVMSNVRRSRGIPPTRRLLNVCSPLVVYGCVRRRWRRHGGRRTEERFSYKRYPIVRLDPDLKMDFAFVFVKPEAVPWFNYRIRVRTMGCWRRLFSWWTSAVPLLHASAIMICCLAPQYRRRLLRRKRRGG